jgi:hypothetical protein
MQRASLHWAFDWIKKDGLLYNTNVNGPNKQSMISQLILFDKEFFPSRVFFENMLQELLGLIKKDTGSSKPSWNSILS